MHPLDSLDKEAWRSRLLAARATLSADARAARDAALTAGALDLGATTGGPICAYVPVGGEPGGPTLVSALAEAGHEVLLPVVPRERGPLEWARFDGSFARGSLVLLLIDDELVERLPAGPHDHPVTAALLPKAGLVTLGKTG